MRNAITLIAIERTRQIFEESYSSSHDDAHHDGDLAIAAACYVMPKDMLRYRDGIKNHVPEDWPWYAKHWKPSPDDRIKELVKAGALIAAEIDKRQRAMEKKNAE